jgi:hypothetical protein
MTITPKHTAATAAVLVSLGLAATASAAQAPTLSAPTIRMAGQTTPVSVPGNRLMQGATIRKGTELRRWLVTMHGASATPVVLRCSQGAKHAGLAQQEGARVSAVVARGSGYGRRTIKVQFHTAPGVDANGAKASVYALCKAPSN